MSSQLDERIRQMMQQVVDESPPPPDMSAGMGLTPVVDRRVPNWVFAVTAAVVVLVVLGGTGWLFGGYGTDVVGEPVVFDFASDSLCEWFSPEEIQAIVSSTHMELGVPLDPTDQMQQITTRTSTATGRIRSFRSQSTSRESRRDRSNHTLPLARASKCPT